MDQILIGLALTAFVVAEVTNSWQVIPNGQIAARNGPARTSIISWQLSRTPEGDAT